MREPAVQSALYDIVRNFYRRIPAEFRAVVALSAENGGYNACPVYLSDARAFKDLDGSFAAYLRGRFLRDFGCDLLLVGGPGFRGKAALDGYFETTLDKNLQFDDGSLIKLASVGAGYDSARLDVLPEKPTHRSDDSYRSAWRAAVEKHPNFVLLDGWNDYTMGREIAPSLEAGYDAVDLTRVYTRALSSPTKFGIKYLWNDVPRQIVSGEKYTVHLRAQNTGLTSWGAPAGAHAGGRTDIPVSFHALFRQGGATVATSEAAPLPVETITPGQNGMLTVSASAVQRNGAPLPEGDYLLCVAPIAAGETGKNAQSDPQAYALAVPVHVSAKAGRSGANSPRSAEEGGVPAWAGSVVRSELPMIMEAGSGYLADATLRNEGDRNLAQGRPRNAAPLSHRRE